MRLAQTSLFHPIAFSLRGLCPVFAFVFLLAGCAAPDLAPVKTPAPPAHLVVINQTDYEWRVTVHRVSGESVRELRVLARASETIDVAGGDYVIEQTMLPTAGAPELSRAIPSRLEPGQTYRWRLATLLSESKGDSDAP
ncbi:MAG TPA: hypothetical protein VGM64_19130 [Lacunisphaera sp.]|jgi:hypothetical protein